MVCMASPEYLVSIKLISLTTKLLRESAFGTYNLLECFTTARKQNFWNKMEDSMMRIGSRSSGSLEFRSATLLVPSIC